MININCSFWSSDATALHGYLRPSRQLIMPRIKDKYVRDSADAPGKFAARRGSYDGFYPHIRTLPGTVDASRMLTRTESEDMYSQ